jgi:hypothetical protein
MGSLYRRGDIWWVKYYANGCPIRESTGTEKETEARRFLREREGRVAIGQPILRRTERIGYEEAAQDLRQHYQTTGSRNLGEAGHRLKHLDAFFVGRRIAAIGPAESPPMRRRGSRRARPTERSIESSRCCIR